MNQTYYLDRVVNKLVNETIIENERIYSPFNPSPPYDYLPIAFSPPLLPIITFSKYLIMEYGLTEKEVVYVWKQYWDIINNRPNYSKHP